MDRTRLLFINNVCVESFFQTNVALCSAVSLNLTLLAPSPKILYLCIGKEGSPARVAFSCGFCAKTSSANGFNKSAGRKN